jgi:outer membrane protein OmpA-like peptidoglycan-associated protein
VDLRIGKSRIVREPTKRGSGLNQDRARLEQEQQKQKDDRAKLEQDRARAGRDKALEGSLRQREQRLRAEEDRLRAQEDQLKGREERFRREHGRLQNAERRLDRLQDIQQQRRERVEAGGQRTIIEEPDRRVIIREQGRAIIRHDETARFSRLNRDIRTDRRRDGITLNIFTRRDGGEVVSEIDDEGRLLRRYRRDRSGREIVLIDNRNYYRQRGRGEGFVFIDLPAPRINIPRDKYIVDYSAASGEDLYEALTAPPVERVDRSYSLEEVRRSHPVRERMRRVDLDDINFEFGSWELTDDQMPKLERLASVIKSILERRPTEVFLIEGHTDAVGSDVDNLTLSDRRAEAVAVTLSDSFEVSPENLTTQGYGEQFLKVDTQDAERANRRVAVRRITPLLSRVGEPDRSPKDRFR